MEPPLAAMVIRSPLSSLWVYIQTATPWVVDGPASCGRLRANWTYAELTDRLAQQEGIHVRSRRLLSPAGRPDIPPLARTSSLDKKAAK